MEILQKNINIFFAMFLNFFTDESIKTCLHKFCFMFYVHVIICIFDVLEIIRLRYFYTLLISDLKK